jgi:hypothetical protein
MSPQNRVCSKDPAHDLSQAEPFATVCPVCGRQLIDAPAKPDDTVIQPGDTAVDPDPPALPAPGVACEKVPDHGVAGRDAAATTCPQPGCGGRLIQLECETSLEHDVGRIKPGETTCPICQGRLLTPSCTDNPAHSMLRRIAGGDACPVCGKNVTRQRYAPKIEEIEIKENRQKADPTPQTISPKMVLGIIVAAAFALTWLFMFMKVLVKENAHTREVLSLVVAAVVAVIVGGIFSMFSVLFRRS